MWHSEGPVIRRMRTIGAQFTGRARTRPALADHVRIDAEMQRRYSGEDREYAIDRGEMTAPDALALSIDETDRDRGERRSAEHEERCRCVLVHAHELAEDCGQRERNERPPAPPHPTGYAETESVTARGLGECSFRTEHAAPGAAEHEHRRDHERPPQAPEQPLRGHDEIVVPACIVGRNRQEGRHNDENYVRCDNAPLHGLDGAAMHKHPLAERGKPRQVQGREAVVAT